MAARFGGAGMRWKLWMLPLVGQGMGEFVPWLRISLFKAKCCLMTAGNFGCPFPAAALYLKV